MVCVHSFILSDIAATGALCVSVSLHFPLGNPPLLQELPHVLSCDFSSLSSSARLLVQTCQGILSSGWQPSPQPPSDSRHSHCPPAAGSPSTNKPPTTVTLPHQTRLTLDPDTPSALVALGPVAFRITFGLLLVSQQSECPQSQLVKGKCLPGGPVQVGHLLIAAFANYACTRD